MFASILTLKN